jgi:hypothetical protein
VSGLRHALNLRPSVDQHVSGWRHVATCTFPVSCADSVSLDGGTLSTYALLVVWPDMSLDGGTLSTCTFPESLHGSIQYPVHVLK